MSITITKDTVGVWFVQLQGNNGHDDWMAGVTQKSPGKFEVAYRFRYADPLEPGASPWENIDRKSWWRATFEGSLDAAIEPMRELAKMIHQTNGTREPVEEILMVDGDVERFMRELTSKPWAHAQEQKA